MTTTLGVLLMIVVGLATADRTSSSSSSRSRTVTTSLTTSGVCDTSLATLLFVSNTLFGNCTHGVDSKICEQLDPTGFHSPGDTDLLRPVTQLINQHNVTMAESVASDLDYFIQATLAGFASEAATEGEVAYALSETVETWSSMSPETTTNSQFWDAWLTSFTTIATNLANEAESFLDSYGGPTWANEQAANMYRRAAFYLGMAQAQDCLTDEALESFYLSYEYMFTWLELTEKIDYVNVTIPYTTDDGVDTTLPGYFFTSSSQESDSLPPLVIEACGGFDQALANVLGERLDSLLDAGFAVLIYEGPGQSSVVRRADTPLTFTPKWDRVVTAVAKAARNDATINTLWDTYAGVSAYALSFGGYINAQACTGVSIDDIQGCVSDPGNPNFAFSIFYLALGPLLGPFGSVDPSLIESHIGSAGYDMMTYFFNVNSTHTQAAYRDCEFMRGLVSSECYYANECFVGFFANAFDTPVISSGLMYVLFKMIPQGPNTFSSLQELSDIIDSDPQRAAELFLIAYNNFLDYRVTREEVNGTAPRVMVIAGEEDFTSEGANARAYFGELNPANNNKFLWLPASSGGAQHDEGGAGPVVEPELIAFLKSVAYGS